MALTSHESGLMLPERTALHANFPNPFNPSTTIAYDLRDAADVTIVIYNVRGQVVRTLVDAVTPPGRHRVVWQGTSDTGARVATGIYFYRLVAGEFSQTRKMVLLK
jgi:flagellar hook assembly protein FlgD